MKSEYVLVKRELLDRVSTEADHVLGFTYASNYEECRAAVDELRAVLAQEAGKCEPAKENKQFEAWARTQSQVDLRLCDIGLYLSRETGLAHDAWQHRASLCASQPAPVSVALELRNMIGMFQHKATTPLEQETLRNARACIDKVKELNQ